MCHSVGREMGLGVGRAGESFFAKGGGGAMAIIMTIFTVFMTLMFLRA